MNKLVPIANPDTGEVVSLKGASDEQLAEIVPAINRRMDLLKDMREQVEGELLNRLTARSRESDQIGPWQVSIETGARREWDPDELETAVRELADDGTLSLGEWTGLIRKESKVDGRAAQRLLGSLQGAALRAVSNCFTWRTGKPRVKVEPVKAIESTAIEEFPA